MVERIYTSTNMSKLLEATHLNRIPTSEEIASIMPLVIEEDGPLKDYESYVPYHNEKFVARRGPCANGDDKILYDAFHCGNLTPAVEILSNAHISEDEIKEFLKNGCDERILEQWILASEQQNDDEIQFDRLICIFFECRCRR